MNDKWIQEGGTFSAVGGDVLRPAITAGSYDVIRSFGRYLFSLKERVTDNLYDIEETVTGEVISSLEAFWEKEELFKKYGFVHKRGILLYGAPGTGKTSLIGQICNKAIEDFNAVCLFSQDMGHLGAAAKVIATQEPGRRIIVVIEDVDNYLEWSEVELLSMLDGENQVNNIVYLATTNYVTELPPRIANRPSRFDRLVKVGTPSARAREQYLLSVAPDLDKALVSELAEKTEGLSFAHLKEAFISTVILGNTVDETVDILRAMEVEAKDSDDGDEPEEA